jgi:DNA-binding CsgD family transcriptional regulator
LGTLVGAFEKGNFLQSANQVLAMGKQTGRPEKARPLRNEADLDRRVRSFGTTYGLSEREQQILRLLAVGTHPKAIGAQVGCAYSSVRTHLRRAAKKLSCSGTREIVIRFFSDGPNAR